MEHRKYSSDNNEIISSKSNFDIRFDMLLK